MSAKTAFIGRGPLFRDAAPVLGSAWRSWPRFAAMAIFTWAKPRAFLCSFLSRRLAAFSRSWRSQAPRPKVSNRERDTARIAANPL